MNFDLWKKTGIIKPFSSVEECEEFIEDCVKIPQLDPFINSPLKRSKVKRGYNNRSEHFDSFAEFTFVSYMRLIKGYVVERNQKTIFLHYIDPNGKTCKYYPDFSVNGTFCEVKGRFSDKDRCKMEQHPEVKWYFQSDIEEMKKELDKLQPDWRIDFIQTN